MRFGLALFLSIVILCACKPKPVLNTLDCFESKLKLGGSSIEHYMATVQKTGSYMKKGDQDSFQFMRDSVKAILLDSDFLTEDDFNLKQMIDCLSTSSQLTDESSGVSQLHKFFKELNEKEEWDGGDPLEYIGRISNMAKNVNDTDKEFETAFYISYFCIDIHLERVYTQGIGAN